MKIYVKINPSKGYVEVEEVWAVACFYCKSRFAKKVDSGKDFEREIWAVGWHQSPNGLWQCPKCSAQLAEQAKRRGSR